MRGSISRSLAGVALAMLVCRSPAVFAQVALGTAQGFAVLGASAITNTGPTSITGDLGLSPGTSVTGFPPGMVTGTMHITDAVALQAQSDANTAYNTLAGSACDFDLSGQDLGGLTLIPGVYCFTSSAQLTGALTLDAGGNPSAEFIFKIGSTLTTASGSSVVLINGGTGCNVYWQIGSSATLGSTTDFAGNVLATASITLATGATVSGRLLALNGAVTMDSNDVSIPIECQNVVSQGTGCIGSNGTAPVLAMTTPIAGFDVTLSITNGLAGSSAILFLGGAASHTNACGCELLVRPGPLSLIIPLSISGSATLVGSIPPGASGSFVLQAFVIDPSAPCGYSGTNAVVVTIG